MRSPASRSVAIESPIIARLPAIAPRKARPTTLPARSPNRTSGAPASKTAGAAMSARKPILRERHHPEWGFRSCLGLLRLAKKYGEARLEAASARALFAGRAQLPPREDHPPTQPRPQPLPGPEAPATAGTTHENVRGRDYYH